MNDECIQSVRKNEAENSEEIISRHKKNILLIRKHFKGYLGACIVTV